MAAGVSRASTASEKEDSAVIQSQLEATIIPTGQFIAFGAGPVLETSRMSGEGRDAGYVQEENRPAPSSQEDASVLEA